MFTITMGAKGQFVLPKAVREHFKLLPGCKVDVTVDENRRLILTPALHVRVLVGDDPAQTRTILDIVGKDWLRASLARLVPAQALKPKR